MLNQSIELSTVDFQYQRPGLSQKQVIGALDSFKNKIAPLLFFKSPPIVYYQSLTIVSLN